METTTKSRLRRFQPLLVWGVLGLAIVGVYAWLGTEGAEPERRGKEKKVVPVTVESVRLQPVQHAVSVVGTLFGFEEVPLTVKVDGRVVKIHHDVGDIVRPGDPLLDLESTDYDLAVQEASRALELELTRLKPGLTELPGREFDVEAVPGVLRAAAHEKNMRSRLDRALKLGNAISAEDRDAAQRDFSVAAAELQQARLEAQATLASARYKKALLDSARQKVKDTRLIVPDWLKDLRPALTAGAKGPEFVVAQRAISEGEMARNLPIGPTVLFKLVMVSPLKLKATVPERFRAHVKLGQKALLRTEAYPDVDFCGAVTRINPAIDKMSRTFEAEIQVRNEDGRISPGAFAKVSILTHVDPAAVTVPEEAVVRFAGVTKIFVTDGVAAKEVQLKTGVVIEEAGERPRNWVELLTPLPPGAQVVTSGQASLADGTAVRVR